MRKGCLLGPADVATLHAAGVTSVTVARLDPDDIHEDAAAFAVAQALVPNPAAAGLTLRAVGTGRVNIHADVTGILDLTADRVAALNAVDPMITLATVPRWQRVSAGEMVGVINVHHKESHAHTPEEIGLVTFIGEPLTWQLVRDAWPDAATDETGGRSGGQP